MCFQILDIFRRYEKIDLFVYKVCLEWETKILPLLLVYEM